MTDAGINQRIADLTREKTRLLEDLRNLTARIIGEVACCDSEAWLLSLTPDENAEMVKHVRYLLDYQARIRGVNGSIQALAR
jgi:hypothetical protein